jgi:hypothetical protein
MEAEEDSDEGGDSEPDLEAQGWTQKETSM